MFGQSSLGTTQDGWMPPRIFITHGRVWQPDG
jgi:hypothetical protein